jgi:hypothetical protein
MAVLEHVKWRSLDRWSYGGSFFEEKPIQSDLLSNNAKGIPPKVHRLVSLGYSVQP